MLIVRFLKANGSRSLHGPFPVVTVNGGCLLGGGTRGRRVIATFTTAHGGGWYLPTPGGTPEKPTDSTFWREFEVIEMRPAVTLAPEETT
tara:strand:+ start:487 stop:756 length:270 start_codon:yes stop_codon:yes gene_type:complete